MAELGIKLKIDGVETTLKSFGDVEDRIASLKKQLNSAEVGGPKFKDLQKELKATEAAYSGAQIKNQSFLDSLAKAPGIMGTLGQSIKGVGQGFQALAANPFVAVASVLVAIVTKIIEKMSTMEVVTDALGKVMGAFGAIVGNIVSAVVTPLAEGIAFLIDGVTSLMSVFSDSAKDGADFADALDSATEAEKENAIAVAEANAQLAEARERAADATLSVQERTQALRDAAAIEKKVTDDSIKINTQKLAAQLGTIATEMGARKELIDQIKSGSLEEIKAARASLLAMKNVDKDKVYALDQMIIEIEKSKKQSANIQRKTDKEIAAIENQAQKDKEAAAKDAEQKRLERIKKANAAAIKELDAGIANEIAAEETKKEKLKELLDKRMAYDLQGVKKGSEEETKIRREYAEKLTQALDADAKKRSADAIKALDETNKKNADAAKKDLETIQTSRDEQYQAIQQALSKEEITKEEARQRTFQAAKAAADKELQLLKDQKQGEINELEKVKDKLDPEERKKKELAINEKYDAQITAKNKEVNKLNLDNTLQTNQEISDANKKAKEDKNALLEQELNDEATSYARRKEIITQQETDLLNQVGLTEDAKTKIRQDATKKREAVDMAAFEARAAITSAELDLAAQAGKFLQEIAGKNKGVAIAGVVVEQAAAIGKIIQNTAVANAKSVAAFPLTAGMPWVAINTVSAGLSIASSIAAGVKAINQIKSADEGSGSGEGSKPATPAVGSKFAKGGLLTGPSHSEGGIKSPYGELEGGEFVINKRSTQSFLPMLSAINSVGNRKYANGGVTESLSAIQEMMSSQPQPIIKTYVVSSDMSSSMEADKKISDLAKL
jgi:hypothetical protein